MLTVLLAVRSFAGAQRSSNGPATHGTTVDGPDGQTHRTVEVAGRVWFAQNLNYASEGSYCYEGRPENCILQGRLYRWEQALSACPAGWHLSTDREWMELELWVGIPFAELERRGNRGTGESARLKVGGDTGFDVQFGGWRKWEDGSFEAMDRNAALWTAGEADLETAWHRDIDIGDDMVYRSRVNKPYALNVRCVRDWASGDLAPAAPANDDCWRIDDHAWWSPDGSRIAFYSDARAPGSDRELRGAFDVYVMDADGKHLRRLTHSPGRDGGPVWSPDGARIAFYSYRDGDAETYVMNADGTGQIRLTHQAGFDFPVGWSRADGRLLGYPDRRGNFDLFTMRPDGSDLKWPTDEPALGLRPAHVLTGRRVDRILRRQPGRWRHAAMVAHRGARPGGRQPGASAARFAASFRIPMICPSHALKLSGRLSLR